jgi:signal transduction histidine kinase
MSSAHKLSKSEPLMDSGPEWNSRILVIDDEVSIAQAIEKILVPDDQGVVSLRRTSRNVETSRTAPSGVDANFLNPSAHQYQVTVVHSPSEALKAIQQAVSEGRPYAMGFFDVMLNADIDGIELVKKVFALDLKMQAVFVTAYSDRSVDSIHQYLGVENAFRWDYVNKPFTQGEISQKARNVVSLWNLREQKLYLDDKIAESQRWLLNAERAHTMAAVSRNFVHEFGNIMTQIMGNCELALMKKEPTRMVSALEVILKASEAASSILNKFKNISNGPGIDSSANQSSASETSLLNITQVFDDALELMRFQFKRNHVEFKKNEFESILLEGKKHSLFQVFMNLLINAVHAMQEGGTIEVSLRKKNELAEILIRDHGTGIPADQIDRLFEPMFTTKGENGSGLGLSICKEIIEIDHQGEIKIENHPSKGAVVTVQIPLRQERI